MFAAGICHEHGLNVTGSADIQGAGQSTTLHRHERGLMSVEELRERKGAMATWWDQVVLPVGRLQDRVDAGVGRMR